MGEITNSALDGSGNFTLVIITLMTLPVLVIIFNEFIFRAGKNERSLVPSIKLLRNYILPLIAVFVVVNQLMGVARASISVKLIETLIYILILNALLAILNVFFFSRGDRSLMATKVPKLFLDIFRVLMVLLGTAIILSVVWGADLGNMVTALGVGSFVLGLALQDTLGNLFAGIALIYEKPFGVGDTIEIEDCCGEVIELNWRAARIITDDNAVVIIPHLIAGSSTIQNYSTPSKIHFLSNTIGFSYDIPPNKIKKILMETMLATPGLLSDPNPSVETIEYADNCINYKVTFAVADYNDGDPVMDYFMTHVWYASRRHQLEMPYPHLNILNSNDAIQHHKTEEALLNKELDEILKIIPINKDQIPLLKQGTRRLSYGAGEYIIRLGEQAGDIFVLKSGKVKMLFGDDEYEQERFLFAGDFFGEVTTTTTRKNSFSILVIEDVELLVFAQAQVIEMIESNPKLAFYLDSDIQLGAPKTSYEHQVT